jgi:hypothetical protein
VEACRKALAGVLGHPVLLEVSVEPELIAGLELIPSFQPYPNPEQRELFLSGLRLAAGRGDMTATRRLAAIPAADVVGHPGRARPGAPQPRPRIRG